MLVQLFRGMCCLSVVDDFRALSRFNLRELCAVGGEAEAEGAANDTAEESQPAWKNL